MAKKIFLFGSAAMMAFGLVACSEVSSKSNVSEHTAEEQTKETAEEPVIDNEQKQMAIEALKGIIENAEAGIVYRFSEGFKLGEATRGEVYAAIGEPEEQLDEYDFYHGSMGNASYQIAYDENDVMKEARYFGTNVERQTNLGGITKEDLLEHAGEPAEEREIPATGEINIIYQLGKYEVQFVLAKDGTADHVNLLKKDK